MIFIRLESVSSIALWPSERRTASFGIGSAVTPNMTASSDPNDPPLSLCGLLKRTGANAMFPRTSFHRRALFSPREPRSFTGVYGI
jgi:hypothetical protein